MYASADAVGIEQQPVLDSNRSMQLYSICFIIIGSFLMLNLLAGVVVEKFMQVGLRNYGEGEINPKTRASCWGGRGGSQIAGTELFAQ